MAPSDPGVRATQVGGFTFGKWDPHSSTLQVQAEKAGIGRIAGVLIGKILVTPHFPPARRNPPPYTVFTYNLKTKNRAQSLTKVG